MTYSKVILSDYLYIPVKELRTGLRAAVRSLVVTSKFGGPPIPLWSGRRPGYLGVPRYYFRNVESVARTVVDEMSYGRQIVLRLTSELWDDQIGPIKKFDQCYRNGRRGFVLEAPPGSGKTVMLIKMMEMLGKTALVVVPRSNLVEQWIDRLIEHSNLSRRDIGIVEEGRGVWRGKSVVVGLVHSVVLDRYGSGFRDYFGTVVFDEVDRSVPPETFAPAVAMFPAAYRIGASATVERPDGLHVIIQKHIEQVRIRCRGKNRMKPLVVMHFFHESSGYVHMGSRKMNRRGMLLSRIASNPKRNLIICGYVKKLYDSGRRVLVLSDRKQQLVDLKTILVKRFGIPRKEIGFYVRSLPVSGKEVSVSDSERRRVASACKVILATYGMFGLGTDIPDLAGLVYATPQSDVRQTKGRIERISEGKKSPIVVDIVDTYYRDALGWANARRRRYMMEGLPVKRSKWG